MKYTLAILPALAAATLFTAGCVSDDYAGTTYSASQVRTAQSVQLGTITAMRNVKIQSDTDGVIGGVAGAVVGAALGNTIGGGSGRTVATALGGVAGAMAGQGAEKAIGTKAAVEFEVKLQNGSLIVVTQQLGNDNFQIGDQVRVITDGRGTTRLAR